MEFFLSDQNVPFMVALLIVLLIALLEGASALIGISSTLFDQLDPDYDVDSSLGAPLHKITIVEWIFAWIRVPGVPALIVLLIFSFYFGFAGLLLQSLSVAYLGFMQSLMSAMPLAFGIAFPLSRLTAHGVAYLIPKDSSSAISWHALIGSMAVITLGKAKAGFPARAKAKDSLGKIHHFMVEPEDPQDIFACGEQVVLVRCVKGYYFAAHAKDTV